MTQITNEEEYLAFKQSVRGIVIKTIIGAVVGFFIGISIGDGLLTYTLLFAGLPYAWSVLPFSAWGIVGIIIKFTVAMIGGWIITPVAFIYNYSQMKKYEAEFLMANQSDVVPTTTEIDESEM